MRGTAFFLTAITFTAFPTAFAHTAGEAAFSITPPSLNVTEGETFTLQVMVDPNQESLDTARLFLSFPAELLRMDEAVLNGDFERSSPGNSIDNENGALSYGGFSLDGPVEVSGPFLLLTLTAVSDGTATIEVLETSRLISAGEERANGRAHEGATVTVSLSQAPVPETRVETVVTKEGASQSQVFQTLSGIDLTSPTHPDPEDWWPSTHAEFYWSLTSSVESVYRYFTSFDHDPLAEPTEAVFADTTSAVYDAAAEGIWYFHIAAELPDGARTSTLHRYVKIDATPPNPIVPDVSQVRLTEGGDVDVTFGTTDDLSGMDHYELSVNKQGFAVAESPVALNDLAAGDYLVEVKAVDRAGNERYGFNSFRVYTRGVLPEEGSRPGLLITLILVGACIFGIICAICWRKKYLKKIR